MWTPRRLITTALLSLLALLAAAATALASPGVVRVVQIPPSLGHSVAVTGVSGDVYRVDPGPMQIRVTPGTGDAFDAVAWCVLIRAGIAEGTDYSVDLQNAGTTAALTTPAAQEAAWLMTQAQALTGAAAKPGFEAAAIQVAVWQLTGQAADVQNVTADTALNTRVAALRSLAAGKHAAAAVGITAPATSQAGTPTDLTVTGTPGATIRLAVSAGAAALSQPSVTLGADGTGHASLMATAAGTVTVTAEADSGLLWKVVHPASRPAQNIEFVVPGTVTASATLSATAAPAPSVVPPVTVQEVLPAVQPKAVLNLTKRAPVSVLRRLEIPYTLKVTNLSGITATDVVVRDAVPGGTMLTGTPARARLQGGVVVWQLGDLAPKASVTLHLRLRTLTGVGTRVVNWARASASTALAVRAHAVTRIRPLPGAVKPAVTG
ncbi:MAG: hypothetical protein U0Y82_05880 [Thermoleophilia bacterium]